MARKPLPVGIEATEKKAFVWAVDWPGWCRSGKSDEAAIEALLAYAPRYAEVAALAGLRFPATPPSDVEIVERVQGNASTEFGVPGAIVDADRQKVTAAQATKHAALLRAAWAALDTIAAGSPESLRKGPRGGGRDRDKMLGHVLDSEAAYGRQISLKHKPPAVGDADAIAAMRDEIAEVLGRASDGTPHREKGWPPRYAVRRIVWHVLDHAWEMQDRREP